MQQGGIRPNQCILISAEMNIYLLEFQSSLRLVTMQEDLCLNSRQATWNILYNLKSLVCTHLNRKLLNLNIYRMIGYDKNWGERGNGETSVLMTFVHLLCPASRTQLLLTSSDVLVVPLPKSLVLDRIQEDLGKSGPGEARDHLHLPLVSLICVYSPICLAYTFREMEVESMYPKLVRNIGLSLISLWEGLLECSE